MSDNVRVVHENEKGFLGLHALLHRRHTLGGNSSLASVPTHAPILWRTVIPSRSRSILLPTSETEEVVNCRTTIDGSMRTTRATSDTPCFNRSAGYKCAFALHDVDAFSVQRAKVIRRVSEKRYVRFCSFFKSFEPEMAMEIQERSAFSREHLDTWVNYIMSPKVLRCIEQTRGTHQELLDLLMVSAAIAKYGEGILMAKDRRGDFNALQNIESYTCEEDSQTCQQTGLSSTKGNNVVMEFVLRINDELSEERRVGGVVLCEILTHASAMTVAVNKSTRDNVDFYVMSEVDRLRQIVARVQTSWFQDAMLKINGRYLYDAIRQAIMNADSLLWDESKDKPELKLPQIQRRDESEAEVMQVESRAASHRHARPRLPPPPPPRAKAVTRMTVLTTNDSLYKTRSIPLLSKTSSENNITICNRSSLLPDDKIHERKNMIIAGMNKVCRRPQLGEKCLSRPRGLPPKRPESMEIDPLVRTPSTSVIKAQERK